MVASMACCSKLGIDFRSQTPKKKNSLITFPVQLLSNMGWIESNVIGIHSPADRKAGNVASKWFSHRFPRSCPPKQKQSMQIGCFSPVIFEAPGPKSMFLVHIGSTWCRCLWFDPRIVVFGSGWMDACRSMVLEEIRLEKIKDRLI